MAFWLYVLIFSLPSIIETARDPINGLLPDYEALEELECEPVSTAGALRLKPGEVPQADRGDHLERRAVICRERLLPRRVRRAQDDAILTSLRTRADALASLTAAAPDRTWLVEVYYPRVAVGQKIGFAVKNALLDRNRVVTDRAPTLAAGDIEVIGRLPHEKAWPLACMRYRAVGALGENDALLAVVLRDHRETMLHAGTCIDGVWRWLR